MEKTDEVPVCHMPMGIGMVGMTKNPEPWWDHGGNNQEPRIQQWTSKQIHHKIFADIGNFVAGSAIY